MLSTNIGCMSISYHDLSPSISLQQKIIHTFQKLHFNFLYWILLPLMTFSKYIVRFLSHLRYTVPRYQEMMSAK
jgi:hypothetical protein